MKTVGSVGERGLIELFLKIFSKRGEHSLIFSKIPEPFSTETVDTCDAPATSTSDISGSIDFFSGKSDDCAVLDTSSFKDELIVCGTDMLHENTDFPADMDYWKRGWMSAAVNLSDIASMGADPIGFLLNIGFPEDLPLDLAIDFAKGVRDCNSVYNCFVSGGDTDNHQELTVVGTAIGKVSKNKYLTRSGAAPGDLICVSGFPGNSALALDIILKNDLSGNFSNNEYLKNETNNEANNETNNETKNETKNGTETENKTENKTGTPNKTETETGPLHTFLNNLYLPVPRVFEGKAIANSGIATSMTDTSDSLSISLYNLYSESNFGFKIYEDLIPLSDDLIKFAGLYSKNSNPDNSKKSDSDFYSVLYNYALFGGGDFELLFTINPDKLETFSNFSFNLEDFSGSRNKIKIANFNPVHFPTFMSHKYPCPIHIIGQVSDEFSGIYLHSKDGNSKKLKCDGYSSF